MHVCGEQVLLPGLSLSVDEDDTKADVK